MGRPKGSRSKPKPRPDNPPADNMPLPPIAASGEAVSPSDDVLGVERENVCKKWGDAAEGAEDIKPPPTSSLKKRVIIIGLMIILLGILIKLKVDTLSLYNSPTFGNNSFSTYTHNFFGHFDW